MAPPAAVRDELKRTAHRPWPKPAAPWAMVQTWSRLLFMHYPLPPEALRPLIPPVLPLDTYEGEAWVGVVPFRMSFVRPHHLPAVPWLSFFPELNVRTYVTVGGKPGVYFFSLEAGNPLAVWLARALFKLPYYNARMTCWEHDGIVDYRSHRTHRNAPPAAFHGRYGPTGEVFHSAPGSVEAWFTERYALYTTDQQGHIYRGEIHHRRWPLQPARANIHHDTMLAAHNIPAPQTDPLLHYVERIKVAVWPLERTQA